MKTKKIPMRMCLGCREMKEKKSLLRIVKSPEGVVSLDVTGRKPGRGAYVCKDKECLQKAIKQRQIERAFECGLSEEMKAALQQQMEQLNEC